MNRMSELKPRFRRTNRGEIRGERTRHVLTFNPNKAGAGEEIYVNIPKLRAESLFVPDSMSLVFDFKNKNEKSWFRNNLGKLMQKRLEATTLFGIYGTKQRIKIGKILKDHGVYAPHNMVSDMQYVLTLPASEDIINAQNGEKVAGYTLEYESIDNAELAKTVESQFDTGRTLSFEHVTLLKTVKWTNMQLW